MKNNNYTINSFWAYLIVEELIRNNIKYFCISPGSRSTPLTIAAARHPDAKTFVCYDERGAGFMALGIARALDFPAVLICTSGTAAANYYPAVIEAKMDNVPMIILSADRPPELIDNGSNQAIYQNSLYNKYINWEVNLTCPTEDINPSFILTTVDQALYKACSSNKGPVHINNMYRKPLIPYGKYISEEYKNKIISWLENKNPYTTYYPSVKIINNTYINKIINILKICKKGLIIAGRLKSKEEINIIKELSKKLNLPVWADIQSNLKLDKNFKNHINYFNIFIKQLIDNKSYHPDLVLHFGGPLTSNSYLEFVKKINFDHYIVINDFSKRFDPEHKVKIRIETNIKYFCNIIIEKDLKPFNKKYLNSFQELNNSIAIKINKIFDNYSRINEPQISFELSNLLTDKVGLFLANSMSIRNMDNYAVNNGVFIKIAANRGASGIEGNIAAAVGYAVGLQKTTVLLIGDISFIHDLNSLHLINRTKYPIIIIIINNCCGGIFSILPISKVEDVYSEFFLTPHNLCFKDSAMQFNIPYKKINDINKFKYTLKNILDKNKSTIIEVSVDINENNKIQKIINKNILELTNGINYD